ncbi:MAG: hypothetical protein HOQ24_18975 [Mycobacteriaceae bacterium]|nr:hypothetical protein [Mycobacteriaceae bacterium]
MGRVEPSDLREAAKNIDLIVADLGQPSIAPALDLNEKITEQSGFAVSKAVGAAEAMHTNAKTVLTQRFEKIATLLRDSAKGYQGTDAAVAESLVKLNPLNSGL